LVEAAMLADLEIKRRQLENELTSLSSKERVLIVDLQKLEEAIIAELSEKIKAENMILSDLEAMKSDLEAKLRELEGDGLNNRELEESGVRGDDAELEQGYPAEDVEVVGVVENIPEERAVENEKRKIRFF
jgi:hypothetical protein